MSKPQRESSETSRTFEGSWRQIGLADYLTVSLSVIAGEDQNLFIGTISSRLSATRS